MDESGDDREPKSTTAMEPNRSIQKAGRRDRLPEGRRRRAVKLADRLGDLEVSGVSQARLAANEPKVVTVNFSRLPQRRRRPPYGTWIAFLLLVVCPTVAGGIYYFKIASDVYAADFKFAVTDMSSTQSSSSGMSGMASALGVGLGATPTETADYMVTDYVQSKPVIEQLRSKLDLIEKYSYPGVDWWSRWNKKQPIEKFVDYWHGMIRADYDQSTGLATVEVKAFTADDAYKIANELVHLSETLVNAIARRPLDESVRVADREVKRDEDRLKSIRAEMTSYRNTEGVIDPTSGVLVGNAVLAQQIRQNIAQIQQELSVLTSQHLSKASPTFRVLQSRLDAAQAQLATVESDVSRKRGRSSPLSKVAAEYEQLDLERQFAATALTGAQATLEQARATALTQRMFITPYVQPMKPTSPVYPRRWLSFLAVFLTSFLAWASLVLIYRSLAVSK